MSDKVKLQDGEGDAQIRACVRERHCVDDLEGECSKCGHAIYYRPEPPFLVTFMCIECAMQFLKQPDTQVRVSTKTAKFVRDNLT